MSQVSKTRANFFVRQNLQRNDVTSIQKPSPHILFCRWPKTYRKSPFTAQERCTLQNIICLVDYFDYENAEY